MFDERQVLPEAMSLTRLAGDRVDDLSQDPTLDLMQNLMRNLLRVGRLGVVSGVGASLENLSDNVLIPNKPLGEAEFANRNLLAARKARDPAGLQQASQCSRICVDAFSDRNARFG